MSAVRLRGAESVAARLVLGWVRFYTRDINSETATAREAELVSDVWEQTNDSDLVRRGRSILLLWRALRGVPADLTWRFRALRERDGEDSSLFVRWEDGGLAIVLLSQSFVVGTLLLAAILLLLRGGNAGSLGSQLPTTLAALGGGLCVAILGFCLLLSGARRSLGALLTGGATAVLVGIGFPALAHVSTTVSAVYYSTTFMGGHPSWSDVLHGALVVLAIFHASVALAWIPRPRQFDERAGR